MFGRRVDFEVAALGVIAHALLDGCTPAGELFLLNRGVLGKVFQQIGAVFDREFASGGLDLGDGRHGENVSRASVEDKRDFGWELTLRRSSRSRCV